MGITFLFYGSLVLFLRFGGNFSTNPLWPFIRVGCKWTLFSWMIYGGVVIGKRLSSTIIHELKSKIKNLETELFNSKEEQNLLKAELVKIQEKHVKEIQEQRSNEAALRTKLQRFERTPLEANRLALKDFL